VHPAAISNALPEQVALRDNSLAPAHAPNTQPAAGLQDLAVRAAHLVDALDLALVRALALRVPAALAHARVLAALRLPARHRARSVHRRIALDAADSSIPRRRKAQ
jgi:hypothetical protein